MQRHSFELSHTVWATRLCRRDSAVGPMPMEMLSTFTAATRGDRGRRRNFVRAPIYARSLKPFLFEFRLRLVVASMTIKFANIPSIAYTWIKLYNLNRPRYVLCLQK